MKLNEAFLDRLNIVQLKELYMEFWLLDEKESSEEVFNYIKENYPAVIEEEI